MNAEQFRSLHDRTARDLLGYLLRRALSAEDAADCLAETFLIAWAKRNEIPLSEERARPWLFGVARNVLRRDRELKQRASSVVIELSRELAHNVAVARTSGPVTHALEQLSPLDREIIEMLAWDKLSPREVATILDLTPNVVRIRSHRARLRLRQHLATDSPDIAERATR